MLIIAIFLFSKIIISPIKQTAEKIRNLKLWKDFQVIKYEKADEIWLLVNAINGLNTKLNIQDNIRNRMLADISHELKTQITYEKYYLDLIIDGGNFVRYKNKAIMTDKIFKENPSKSKDEITQLSHIKNH